MERVEHGTYFRGFSIVSDYEGGRVRLATLR
jgi:hypothetical protein